MSERPDPWVTVTTLPASYADADEITAIADDFYNKPWEDATRFPDGFRILLGAMVAIAEGNAPDPRQRATQALRRVQRRVLIGEDQAEVDRHV